MGGEPCLGCVLDFRPNRERSMEAFLLRRAARLRASGWRSAFVFSGEPSPRFDAELRALDSPWTIAKFPLANRQTAEIGRWLRQFNTAAVETSFLSKFARPVVRLKRAAGARFWVCADHTSGAVNRGGPAKRLHARIRGWLTSRTMDRLICVSDYIRQRDMRHLYLSAPSRVVHNGIDLTRFTLARVVPAPGAIGYAGQLIPAKGVQTLIRAVGMLPDVRLRIAGQGLYEAELRALAASQAPSRVEFLGQIDAVEELFAGSAVVVIPSEWDEAFGFVAIEAMACGSAVVVSDAGALPEVVGDAGVVFPRGDVARLAEVLGGLLADPKRLANCRSLARPQAEKFSMDRMVDGYVAVYDELRAELNSTPG
jgi:glycosyltransferase involved in cell wall biosynthesis